MDKVLNFSHKVLLLKLIICLQWRSKMDELALLWMLFRKDDDNDGDDGNGGLGIIILIIILIILL